MKLVIIESPFRGRTEDESDLFAEYLNEAIRDCALKGESAYASHRMLTGALDDSLPGERTLGIMLGLEWAHKANEVIVYEDHGISEGMKLAIGVHESWGRKITYRKLYK